MELRAELFDVDEARRLDAGAAAGLARAGLGPLLVSADSEKRTLFSLRSPTILLGFAASELGACPRARWS